MDEFNRVVNEALSILDNQIVSSVLGLFLVLYAGLAAPKLPRSIARLFDNPVFRVIVLFLVAFMATKNKSVALIAAVGLVVSFQTLNRHKMNDQLINAIEEESVVAPNTAETAVEQPVQEEEITGVATGDFAGLPTEEEQALYLAEEEVMQHVHAAEEETHRHAHQEETHRHAHQEEHRMGFTEDEENIAEVMGEEEMQMAISGFGGNEYAEL
jgi:hypothetical protein